MGKRLWVVGNKKKETKDRDIWTFCGVYSTQEKAEEVAKRFNKGFVGPVILDDEAAAGEEIEEWPDAYYVK